jgi:hypothetical protein
MNIAEIITMVIIIAIVLADVIFGFYGHSISYGDPRLTWIAVPLLLLLSFSSWKDRKELFKRCILASPFVLLFILLLFGIGAKIQVICIFGTLLFVSLIDETRNWKRHYIITLISTAILFLLAVSFKIYAPSLWNIYIVLGFAFAVLVFYRAYEKRLLHGQKEIKLYPLAVQSVKFAAACFIPLVLLSATFILYKQYHLGFATSFIIAMLIAMSYWVTCKLFNIEDPTHSDGPESKVKEVKRTDECECCGKTGLPQELLFKIDSGQRVCAACLAKMDNKQG